MTAESMNAETTSPPDEPSPLRAWPPEKLRAGLLADDPNLRLEVLGLTVQPESNIDGCAEAIVSCVVRGVDEPLVAQIAVVALGNVRVQSERPVAVACLVTLCAPAYPADVRAFAVHGLAQQGVIPEAAWINIAPLLFDEDSYVRKGVLHAIAPFAALGATHIAQCTAARSPSQWTSEGLTALALSAGTSDDNKRRIEQFILRSLQGQSMFPAAVAGYAALAKLNPKSVAPVALARIAHDADDQTALAAIDAIVSLGASASAALPVLVEALEKTENMDREQALCNALVHLQIRAADVPLPRVVERIGSGPGPSVAAHCSLLCLHPRVFAATASVVASRHARAGEALQEALSAVHQTLVGKPLAPVVPVASPVQQLVASKI